MNRNRSRTLALAGPGSVTSIRLAVKRMIPPGALGRKTMKKLKIYASPQHPHVAQQPEPVKLATA